MFSATGSMFTDLTMRFMVALSCCQAIYSAKAFSVKVMSGICQRLQFFQGLGNHLALVELGLRGLQSSRPYYMQFTMQADETAFYGIVCEEAEKDFDALELVYEKEVPVFEKYDEYVPEELVRKGFAYGILDVEGMKQRVLSWKKFGGDQVEA